MDIIITNEPEALIVPDGLEEAVKLAAEKVAELAAGCPVRMVQSTYRNIKLTTPEDLVIGEALLADQKSHQECSSHTHLL